MAYSWLPWEETEESHSSLCCVCHTAWISRNRSKSVQRFWRGRRRGRYVLAWLAVVSRWLHPWSMCLDSFSLVWPFFSGNVPWNFRCFIFFHALRCFLLCLCYSNLMYFIHEVKHELVCGAFVQLFHNPVAFCLRKDKFVPEDTSCCCCLCATNIFVVRQTSQLRPSAHAFIGEMNASGAPFQKNWMEIFQGACVAEACELLQIRGEHFILHNGAQCLMLVRFRNEPRTLFISSDSRMRALHILSWSCRTDNNGIHVCCELIFNLLTVFRKN